MASFDFITWNESWEDLLPLNWAPRCKRARGRGSDYTVEDLKTQALQVLQSPGGATHLADLVRKMIENGIKLSEPHLRTRLRPILATLPQSFFVGARWHRGQKSAP